MSFPPPPPEIARAGMRALVAVARADGTVGDLERQMLTSVQRHILRLDVEMTELEEITPEALAAQVTDATFRERIVGGCVLMALIDGEPSEAELDQVKSYATALKVSTGAVKNLKRLTQKRLLLARFDIARRSFIGNKFREKLANDGIRGIATVLKAMRFGDEKMAARYRTLESYPDGSLGREYARFIRGHDFSFPGEEGSPPELIMVHDCHHVLGGYETTPSEEVAVACFTAGFSNQDPFSTILFIVAQFHLGLQITPSAEAFEMVVSPDAMTKAISRGSQVNVDLADNWHPWQGDFDLQVDELRRRYNIVPR